LSLREMRPKRKSNRTVSGEVDQKAETSTCSGQKEKKAFGGCARLNSATRQRGKPIRGSGQAERERWQNNLITSVSGAGKEAPKRGRHKSGFEGTRRKAPA